MLPGHSRHRSYVALSRALEEEPNDQNLQSRHPNHHANLDQTEIEDPVLGTPDRAEVPVFSCAEVFLHATDGAELAAHFEDRIFERGGLFRRCAGFLREKGGAGLVFDLSWRCVRYWM
jgi:hypothetical protein